MIDLGCVHVQKAPIADVERLEKHIHWRTQQCEYKTSEKWPFFAFCCFGRLIFPFAHSSVGFVSISAVLVFLGFVGSFHWKMCTYVLCHSSSFHLSTSASYVCESEPFIKYK